MAEQKKYSQKELERLIEETTRYGAVYAYLHFDAHGRDEDTVKHSLVDLVDRITKEQGVLYCVGEVLEPYKRAGLKQSDAGGAADESAQGAKEAKPAEKGEFKEKEPVEAEGKGESEKKGTGEWKNAGSQDDEEEKGGGNNEAGEGSGNKDAGEGGGTKVKPEVYSTSAQVTILCNSFIALHQIALRYGLVGVEILSPQHIRLDISDAQSLLLDASQASQEFTAYILQRVLPPEEREKMEEKVRRRADLARQLIEKQAERK